MGLRTVTAAAALATAHAAENFICHLVYSMSDNNLEAAIVGDAIELVSNTDLMEDSRYEAHIYLDRHASSNPSTG